MAHVWHVVGLQSIHVHVHHHFTLGDLVSFGSHFSRSVTLPSPHHKSWALQATSLVPFIHFHVYFQLVSGQTSDHALTFHVPHNHGSVSLILGAE